MESQLLEYLLRVAELGSINKAALDLQLSQPALSRHIARLEEEMGVKLFVRAQSGVRPTDAGLLLCERARPLLRQFTLIKEEVGDKAAGVLSVGIAASWQRVFTSKFVATLVQQYPAISLRVVEGLSDRLRDNMLEGLLDLCIIPFDAASAQGYRQTPLVREPLVLVGPISATLHPAKPVPLSELERLRLVLPGRPNAVRRFVEHGLARRGLVLRVAVETDTLNLCIESARQGIGFTVVPACALVEHPLAHSISWCALQNSYITWALFENRARHHSQAVREGRRIVMKTIEGALAAGDWFGAEVADKRALKAQHAQS